MDLQAGFFLIPYLVDWITPLAQTSQTAGSATVLSTKFSIGNNGKTGINVSPVTVGGQFNDAMLQIKSDGDDNIRLLANDGINDWSIFSNAPA